MSYYRYITGLYKSYWPELNRTLRSSSVPRTLPETDPGHYVRGTSMPPVLTDYIPSTHVTDTYYSARRGRSATPFRDAYQSLAAATDSSYRSMSVQPASYSTSRTLGSESSHYSDFDCKVLSYAASLNRNETTRNFVSKSRNYTTDYSHLSRNATRDYNTDSFSARYDYYAGDKHGRDGLYPCSSEVLGTWKHFNRSADTLNARNARARSPLVSRELDRYYETKKRCNYVGDLSSGGACDFRYYNYRRVPYFGGSDNYAYMRIRPSGSRRI